MSERSGDESAFEDHRCRTDLSYPVWGSGEAVVIQDDEVDDPAYLDGSDPIVDSELLRAVERVAIEEDVERERR